MAICTCKYLAVCCILLGWLIVGIILLIVGGRQFWLSPTEATRIWGFRKWDAFKLNVRVCVVRVATNQTDRMFTGFSTDWFSYLCVSRDMRSSLDNHEHICGSLHHMVSSQQNQRRCQKRSVDHCASLYLSSLNSVGVTSQSVILFELGST